MSDDVPRMPRLGWVVAFVILAVLIVFAAFSVGQIKSQGSSTLDRYGAAPDFHLTAEDGQTVSRDDFKGKIWVVDFVFTRCPGPCPIMTGHMAELNKQLGDKAEDVRLVTITVDPEHDTPEVLKKYAEQAGASPDRWTFLTGPEDQIQAVTTKGFFQALSKESDGMPMHSTRFVLVDRDGQMRSFPDGSEPEVIQKLLTDIKTLQQEPGAKK